VLSDSSFFYGFTLYCLLSVLGCAALLATKRHRAELPFQLRLFLIAFALRFALSVVIYQYGLVTLLGDEDASGWRDGQILQQKWALQGISLLDLPSVLTEAFQERHRGYAYLLGGFFSLTNAPGRLPAAALNGFFGALTVVFVYRIGRTLFSQWVARRAGLLACFFPSMLTWTALTVKEPVVIFLEVVALYSCLQLKQRSGSPRYLFLGVLSIFFLIPFRFYAAFIVGASVLLSLLAPSHLRPQSAFVGVLLLAVFGRLLIPTGVIAPYHADVERFDLGRIQGFRNNVAIGGERMGGRSGVRSAYDVRTPDGLLLGTAFGAAHLLLAPFPWQLRHASRRMFATLPELLYWWWLVFAGLLPGLWYCLRHRLADVRAPLLMLLGFGLLYSMMFGNVGLIFRQRAQLLPWLLIFAAVGLEQRALRRAAAPRAPRREAGKPSAAPRRATPGANLSTPDVRGPEQSPAAEKALRHSDSWERASSS
jgi:hypothetical protein